MRQYKEDCENALNCGLKPDQILFYPQQKKGCGKLKI